MYVYALYVLEGVGEQKKHKKKKDKKPQQSA